MTSLLPEHLIGFALVDNVLLIILLPTLSAICTTHDTAQREYH